MKSDHIYFITGTAYAGKSTMVKRLAEKYNGIACEENYHDALLSGLGQERFPCLTYTRDLRDWRDFIRRTPDEYEAWVKGVSRECETLELDILEQLSAEGKKIFVDTNISLETLREISDKEHVLIMLAEPDISVNRFLKDQTKKSSFYINYSWPKRTPNGQWKISGSV